MESNSKVINRLLEQQGYSEEQISNMYKNFVMSFDGSQLSSIGVTIKVDASRI